MHLDIYDAAQLLDAIEKEIAFLDCLLFAFVNEYNEILLSNTRRRYSNVTLCVAYLILEVLAIGPIGLHNAVDLVDLGMKSTGRNETRQFPFLLLLLRTMKEY